MENKQQYYITGSKQLKKAFIDTLLEKGIKYLTGTTPDFIFDRNCPITIYEKSSGEVQIYALEKQPTSSMIELKLPQDWDKALELFIPILKEVVKEWEILEFKTADNNIWSLQQSGNYKEEYSLAYSLNEMLHEEGCVDSGNFIINKVKRLSDGEVFTIGDKFKPRSYSNPFTIGKFEVYNNDTCLRVIATTGIIFGLDNCLSKVNPLFTSEDGVEMLEDSKGYIYNVETKITNEALVKYIIPACQDKNWKLFSTEEARTKYIDSLNPVIFTTHDGVKIKKSDNYWYVDKKIYFVYSSCITNHNSGKEPDHIYFSTKQLAEEWVFNNKPLFSIEDLLKLDEKYHPAFPVRKGNNLFIFSQEKLLELAKEKLNK